MKLWEFNSYEEYKKSQIIGYELKVDSHSWVDPYSVRGIVSYILDYNPEVSFGLCHGTRQGVEQEEFNRTFESLGLNVTVIGTEIAGEAENRFLDTIEWDFHEVKDEWINSVDFIFSNSFDHSYDPEKALDSWMSCLGEKGLCFIEWTKDSDGKSRPMDPYAASFDEYKELIEQEYEIVEVLENEPDKDEGHDFKGQRFYFVIRNLK